MPPFQQTHSPEFKAACVRRVLDDGLSAATVGRIARAGDLAPGFPASQVIDETIRTWVKAERSRREDAAMLKGSGVPIDRLAAKSFRMAEREIAKLERSQKAKGKDHVPLDPARLERLLLVAERAAKVLGNAGEAESSAVKGKDGPSDDADTEPPPITEAEQTAIDAFGAEQTTATA